MSNNRVHPLITALWLIPAIIAFWVLAGVCMQAMLGQE